MKNRRNSTRLFYRADGGHPIGMGHIQRALRIAKSIAQIRPVDFVLATKEDQAVIQVVRAAELPFLNLKILPNGKRHILPKLEIEPLAQVIREVKPDLIVVDMLDTPAEEMAFLASAAPKLASLDDRGPGRKESHLIINVLVRDPNPNELRPGAKLLQGTAFAPLDDQFSDAGGKRRTWEPDQAENVLVTLGGADAAGLSVKVARGLQQVSEIKNVNFAVGPAFTLLPELKEVTSKAPWNANIAVNAPSLVPMFLSADIAIVAGGFTMHEAACCGAPAVGVAQPIDHQLLVAGWLQEMGAMISLGYGESIGENAISEAVSSLAKDSELRQTMSIQGREAVDGRGTARCAEELVKLIDNNR